MSHQTQEPLDSISKLIFAYSYNKITNSIYTSLCLIALLLQNIYALNKFPVEFWFIRFGGSSSTKRAPQKKLEVAIMKIVKTICIITHPLGVAYWDVYLYVMMSVQQKKCLILFQLRACTGSQPISSRIIFFDANLIHCSLLLAFVLTLGRRRGKKWR